MSLKEPQDGITSEAAVSNWALRYLLSVLSFQANAKLDELSQALISGISEIDASLMSRFEDAMHKLWEIPTDYPGPWPPLSPRLILFARSRKKT